MICFRKPWSVDFLVEWLPRLTLASALRYRDYAIRARGGSLERNSILELTLRRPFGRQLRMRQLGSDGYTFENIFQDRIYNCVLPFLRPGAVIVDLGANIGLAARFFAGVAPGGRIIAVEPCADNVTLLKYNLAACQALGSYEIAEAAIWSVDRMVEIGDVPAGELFDSVTVSVQHETVVQRQVPAISMSSLCNRFDVKDIDLLKVDIEGAELELFSGDVDWLARVRCLAVEFHNRTRAASGFDRLMADYGFRVDDSHPHTTLAYR